MRIELSSLSREDLKSIAHYTYHHYGEAQTQAYLSAIDRSLRQIGDYPEIGHAREDLPSAYRTFRIGEHIIVYKIRNDTVYVSRILHGKMDVRKRDMG
jgi:toxin ParE1/3/4